VLRRIFVSAMQEVASSNMEEFRNWNNDHAALINTSSKVLDENYNRYNNKDKAKQTLSTVNESLSLLPSENAASAVERLASEHLVFNPEHRKVEKVVDEKFVGKDLHYLCQLSGGQQEWISHLILDPFSEQVLEYFDSFGERDATVDSAKLDSDQVVDEDCSIEEESRSISIDLGSKEVSLPSLGSASSLEELSSSESSVQLDDYMTEVAAAVSVVNNNSGKKRKRPSNQQYEVVCLGDRPLKPGDVVSVNPAPSQSSQDFWLAVVHSVTNEDLIKVQWLDRVKGYKYKLVNHFDDLEALMLNGHANGEWLTNVFYSIK
jgi:hypothetical protein